MAKRNRAQTARPACRACAPQHADQKHDNAVRASWDAHLAVA